MKNPIKQLARWFLGASFLGAVYFWPRYLSQTLGEDSPWISYLYTYGLGALFFALTVLWIFSFPSGYSEKRKQDGFWLFALCGALIFGMTLHGIWIYLSVSLPFKG